MEKIVKKIIWFDSPTISKYKKMIEPRVVWIDIGNVLDSLSSA